MKIFGFKEVKFHKIYEVSNVGDVHVIKNSGNGEYKRKIQKSFTCPSQQIMV